MAKAIKGTAAILFYSLFLVIGNSFADKIFPSDGLMLGQGFLFYLPFPALNLHYHETQPLYLGIFMSLAELFLFAFLWFKSKTRPLKILALFLTVNFMVIFGLRFLEVKGLF